MHGLRPEVVVLGPVMDIWPKSQIPLEERSKAGEIYKSVSRQVVWLQVELTEKGAEEIARRKSKAMVEVREEDNIFAILWSGRSLIRGEAAEIGRAHV